MPEVTKPEEPKPDDAGHGMRWLIVGVVVPISVALIGAIGVIVQKSIESNQSAATSVAVTAAAALPVADPIPAEWCFDCSPELVAVARDCRDGSMHACDDLWKTVMDPKGLPDAEAAAVHDYGISCGGRRQLKSPGYRYKDCSDEFPGHQ